jgi:hypothetical protein
MSIGSTCVIPRTCFAGRSLLGCYPPSSAIATLPARHIHLTCITPNPVCGRPLTPSRPYPSPSPGTLLPCAPLGNPCNLRPNLLVWPAPGRPEVHQHHLAAHLIQLELLIRPFRHWYTCFPSNTSSLTVPQPSSPSLHSASPPAASAPRRADRRVHPLRAPAPPHPHRR